MAFIQEKLALSTIQTQDIFNQYVYFPDNGESSTDVTATDYFIHSRYIGDDGWISGIITATLSDGVFQLQIQSDGTTAEIVSGYSPEIPSIVDNLRGFIVIDMENADRTFTLDEAQHGMFVILNAGDGTKELTNPASADATSPINQAFLTIFAGNDFIYRSASDGLITIVGPASDIISYSGGNFVVSNFNSTVSQDPYGIDWATSKYAPSQKEVYDLMYGKGRLLDKITIDSGTEYTPTAGTTDIYAFIQAPGGAGGSTDTAAVSAAVGGGGAAGEFIEFTTAVDDQVTYTLSIGAAGAPSAAGNNDGGDGGDVTITINAIAYTAVGGKGGKGSPAGVTINSVLGGASQSTTPVVGIGNIYQAGMSGLNGLVLTGLLAVSGDGGTAKLGAGAKGINTQGGGVSAATLGYGGGGSGGCTLNGGGATQGGAGAPGIIVIYEFDYTYGA